MKCTLALKQHEQTVAYISLKQISNGVLMNDNEYRPFDRTRTFNKTKEILHYNVETLPQINIFY